MQFENIAFCFLISVQFSGVNSQGMLIPGGKKIQISTRKLNTVHPVSWSAAVFSQPHFHFVLWRFSELKLMNVVRDWLVPTLGMC